MKTLLLVGLALAGCGEKPTENFHLASPIDVSRNVFITVEDTEEQTNVLVDEQDLRVAIVVPRVPSVDAAVGFWNGGDFLICKATLERAEGWLVFDSPCASGSVRLDK